LHNALFHRQKINMTTEKPNLQKLVEEGFKETPTFIVGLQMYQHGEDRVLYDSKKDEVVHRYKYIERRRDRQ